MFASAILCQSLLSFSSASAEPVRFGVPVPFERLRAGLKIRNARGAPFQWSLLQPAPDSTTGRIWIEVALDAGPGRFVLCCGGQPSSPRGSGPAVERVRTLRQSAADEECETTWRWGGSGMIDVVSRTIVKQRVPLADGVELEPGEYTTTGHFVLAQRRRQVEIAPRFWRDAGVLPRDQGRGRELRVTLLDHMQELRRASGVCGRGDYLRGADDEEAVVTNLEFDTTLGFMKLALATGSSDALMRAFESAYHLADHDIDLRSGLPFRHGSSHRSARPELGHCWLQGLLLTGLVFADRGLIDTALELGRSLARAIGSAQPPRHLRDVAWPLLELEALLRFQREPALEQASDGLAAGLLRRWDASLGVFRFEEGEVGANGAYKERCWQTAGIAVPALRAWAHRTGSNEARDAVAAVERRVLALVRAGRPGLPLRYWVRDGEVFGVLYREGAAPGCLLLDGVSAQNLARVLARRGVRRALDGMLDPRSSAFATEFSIVARCEWVYR